MERQTIRLGDALHNVQVKEVAEALTSQDIRLEFDINGVLRFRPIGWTVDAKRVLARHFAVDGDESDREKKFQIMGLSGSYLEHRLWEEQMGISSVSTVNGLQFANETGIPVLTIDESNIDALLPTLNVFPHVRQAVIDAVSAGRVVTIPRDTLVFDEWMGSVWIDDLPGGLSTGYLISGGLLGGSNREKPVPGENPTCTSLDARLGTPEVKGIALFESNWTQFNPRDGRPYTSTAGATGVMQIVPGCCPTLQVGEQPIDYPRTQTDWAYNTDVGNALIAYHSQRISEHYAQEGITLTPQQFHTELYFQYNSGGFRTPKGKKRSEAVFNYKVENGIVVLNNFAAFPENTQAGLRESQRLALNGRAGMPPVHEIVPRELWNDPTILKGCK